MQQLELFPLNLIEQAARKARDKAHQEMLCKVNDAHAEYVTANKDTNRMYADHVIFTDSDMPTFTIVTEFWPDLACRYMDEAHPGMYERISDAIDDSFAK